MDIVSAPLITCCYPIDNMDKMTELSPLITVLTATFAWHGAKITLMAQFLVTLVRVRTVNFAEIATWFCGKAQSESNYRRIQRFFPDIPLTKDRSLSPIEVLPSRFCRDCWTNAVHSNSLERITLLKHFLAEFGRERSQYLTTDREFIGTDWVKFLKRQRSRFCLHIQRNTLVSNPSGTCEISAFRFFRNGQIGEARLLSQPHAAHQRGPGNGD